MSDIVFNIAKGRVAELYHRVQTNDPTNSVLVVVPVDVGATSDATIRDFATLAAVLGGGVTERSTSGWSRVIMDNTVLSALAVDNTNDRMPVDTPDISLGTPTAGAVTDLIICYDSDSTGGADSAIIPLTMHDFAITPDGSAVTATVTDFFRAS